MFSFVCDNFLRQIEAISKAGNFWHDVDLVSSAICLDIVPPLPLSYQDHLANKPKLLDMAAIQKHEINTGQTFGDVYNPCQMR